MSDEIKRRDFLAGALFSVALGGPEMPPFFPSKFIPQVPKPTFNPAYTMQPTASPVHLSAPLVLRSGTSGSPAAAALKNPMGQDMELLEIKFEVAGAYNPALSAVGIFGGTVWCELMLGSIKLTNGAVPVWSFGRSENFEGEVKIDTTDNLAFASFSWRLPRPLFIPAGAVVVPKFTHTAFIPATLSVRIGYSARTVFTKPKKIYVPWVAKYVSKAFNPVSAADVDKSSELDLVNSNPEVVHIQRFTGRAMFLSANGDYSEYVPQGFASQNALVRMTDSYGRPIVRSYTPFRSVFDACTRSWELENSGAELDPGAFYRIEIKKAAVTGTTATNGLGQLFVSMVGWRELDGSGLAAFAPTEEEQ